MSTHADRDRSERPMAATPESIVPAVVRDGSDEAARTWRTGERERIDLDQHHGEMAVVEAFGRIEPVATFPIPPVEVWELEDGDTGRAFWNVDGAASDSETGGNRAAGDAAAATLPEEPETARATPAQVKAVSDALFAHQHDKAMRLAGGWACRCREFVPDSAGLFAHIERVIADAAAAASPPPAAWEIELIQAEWRQRAETAEAKVARVHEVVDGKAGGFAQAVRSALRDVP